MPEKPRIPEDDYSMVVDPDEAEMGNEWTPETINKFQELLRQIGWIEADYKPKVLASFDQAIEGLAALNQQLPDESIRTIARRMAFIATFNGLVVGRKPSNAINIPELWFVLKQMKKALEQSGL